MTWRESMFMSLYTTIVCYHNQKMTHTQIKVLLMSLVLERLLLVVS